MERINTATILEVNNYINVLEKNNAQSGKNIIVFTISDDIWNKIKENKKFYQEESLKRVNESRRPEGPKTISSIFPGVDENFKNLNID